MLLRDEFTLATLHPITKTLLAKRGIVGSDEVCDVLFPSYEKHVGDPFAVHGVEQAVTRIIKALQVNE